MKKNIITAFPTRLRFLLVIIKRSIIILFRKRKKVELLYLDYTYEPIFENSYIFIKYRFRNALSYSFAGYPTLEKEIKIFNLKNFDKEIEFIVYGLFHKKVYQLKFTPTHSLETKSFKTGFSNLSFIPRFKPLPDLAAVGFSPEIKKPIIVIQKALVNIPNIILQTNIYNQNDFI